MKSYSITLLILLCVSIYKIPIFSQNLVPNGNFEEHLSFANCTSAPKPNIQFLLGWKPLGEASSAYCHRDIVRKFGEQNMKEKGYIYFDSLLLSEGNAMVKLIYSENCDNPNVDTGCAAYIKTKLKSPLELGEVYEVSMWVYIRINPAVDTTLYTHIGMFLTRREIFLQNITRIPSDYFFFSRIIPGQWTEVKWYIRALCSLGYLTIGAFKDEAFPSLFRGDPANDIPFYIDQVAIKKVNEDSLSADIHPTPYCEYYEKEDKQRVLESITSLDVHYESNASTLEDKDKMKLDSFYRANFLRKNKIFIIIGHTDSETAENISLSNARAESVKSYLHQKYDLPEMSLLTFGFGSSHPIANNTSSLGRLQNRRTTIRTSDLDIPGLFYRKGVEDAKAGNFELSYSDFSRWLRMVPITKQIEMFVDLRLRNLKHSKYWQKLVATVKEDYSLYKDSKNAFFLDSMYFEDQLCRQRTPIELGAIIEEIDTLEIPEFNFTPEECYHRDSINYLAIQKYLDQSGYPEISNVGRRPARGLGYVILHRGDSMAYVKTLPVLKDLAMKGEAEWDIFAKMSDKLSIIKKEPQEYGTQFQIDSNGVITLYKIDDIDSVNKRRVKIGMSPTAIPEY